MAPESPMVEADLVEPEIIARLRAELSAGESKGPIGPLMLVFNSGSRSSRSRAPSASSARIDSMSCSTLERSDG